MGRTDATVKGAAGGAAAGSVFGPIGTAGGAALGGLFGYLSSGGDSGAPPAAAPAQAYQPNAAAFGALPVNFGMGASQGTQDLQGQYNDLNQQYQDAVSKISAQADAHTQQSRDELAALQKQWNALTPDQQQAAVMVNAPIVRQMQSLSDDVQKGDQQKQSLIDQVNKQFQPQLQSLQGQIGQSQHGDQLGYLSGNSQAALNQQAPQINTGNVPIDWNNAPGPVKFAHAALTGGTALNGQPLTPADRARAQSVIDAYQNQINQSNPLWVDAQHQAEDRGKQSQLIGTLLNAAAGKGPSAALDTLYAGRDANINQAQSMANSARGGTGAQALAERSAINAGAMATQQTAQQAAIMRAQEMQQAYQNLGTALQSQRAGDTTYGGQNIGVATTNAQLQQNQTGQNATNSQNWADLYFKALQGDRDAQMQLEELRSGNQNAANGNNTQAGIANQQVQYNQGVQNTKDTAATLGAIGTFTSGLASSGSGGGSAGGSTSSAPDNSPTKWGY